LISSESEKLKWEKAMDTDDSKSETQKTNRSFGDVSLAYQHTDQLHQCQKKNHFYSLHRSLKLRSSLLRHLFARDSRLLAAPPRSRVSEPPPAPAPEKITRRRPKCGLLPSYATASGFS